MVFVLFLAVLIACVATGQSIIIALAIGLALFFGKACRMGHAPGEVLRMAVRGMLKSKNVILMFVFIGAITGVWRACGTIPWVVTASASLISPRYFVLSAFLLSTLMSILTGTSFGTVSTMGTVLMIIAATNGADPVITAGAVISGAYVGDRASPMSSCARLMSDCAGNDYYDNIGGWIKTALVPIALSCVIYGLNGSDAGMGQAQQALDALRGGFEMHWTLVLPAALILVLSVFKVPVKMNMGISAALGFVLGIFVQGESPFFLLRSMLVGYHLADGSQLAAMIDGGGVTSMMRAGFIVLFSSAYAGIFEGTGMLDWASDLTRKAAKKAGLFPVTMAFGTLLCMVSCNQSLALLLTGQLCAGNYESKKDFAVDLGNSTCLIAGLIPWSIACAIPLSVLGVTAAAIPWSLYLWLNPLCHLCWRLIRPAPMKKTAEETAR